MQLTKPTVVFYHKNCYDGFAAAYCMWLLYGDDADYVAVQYGDDLRKYDVHNRDVYMVDFSADRQTILDMASEAAKVTVLDHHKSAEQNLRGLDCGTDRLSTRFDMKKAGCELAWEHVVKYFALGPDTRRDEPWFLRYIADRDLWNFKLIDTRAVTAWLSLQFGDLSTATFAEWKSMDDDGMTPNILRTGYTILNYEMQRITDYANDVVPCSGFIDNQTVGVVRNVPVWLQSEVGDYVMKHLADKARYSCVVMPMMVRNADGHPEVKLSLRSDNDHADVAETAGRFGGGGHRNAAGCVIAISEAVIAGIF